MASVRAFMRLRAGTNIGALIDRDPAAFRKLKRVVIMGGSIQRGYGDLGYLPNRGPDAEYNVKVDIPAAKKLFTLCT